MSLSAQQKSAVEVEKISFTPERLGRENWIRASVQVRCHGGTPGARGTRTFANRVRVVLTLAYQGASERDFQFYTSEATAISLIAGQQYDYAFYLPYDLLNKRDQIRREPFGYLAEVYVEDELMPLNRNSAGSQPTPETLESFRSRASREAAVNEGVLIPVYLSPFWSPRTAEISPVFLRKDSR